MVQVTRYKCGFCNAEFAYEGECFKHERIHYMSYDTWSKDDLARVASFLATNAAKDDAPDNVLGMPKRGFNNLMTVVAARLRGVEAEE